MSLIMAVVFFLANIWPACLIKMAKKPAPEASLPALPSERRGTVALQKSIAEPVSESRLVKSLRSTVGLDMAIPSTVEHKIYLDHIDEEEADEDENEEDFSKKT